MMDRDRRLGLLMYGHSCPNWLFDEGGVGMIKCAFCDWEIPRFRTNRDGSRKSNYDRLVQHCERLHPDKVRELEASISDPTASEPGYEPYGWD